MIGRLLIGIVLIATVGGALYVLFQPSLDDRAVDSRQLAKLDQVAIPSEPLSDQDQRRVKAFCGACHAIPVPESFSREAWHREVMQGYHFYAKSGRQDLDPPAPETAIAYFRAAAPEVLKFPQSQEASTASRIRFRPEVFAFDAATEVPSAISSLTWCPNEDGKPRLLVSDMRRGSIHAVHWESGLIQTALLGTFSNPCRVTPFARPGLAGRGDTSESLVVADLGSFDPDDHTRGAVRWMSQGQSAVLAEGLGRVSDVRPADFDGDGRLDLAVAEFGWQQTGGIHVLWNSGVSEGNVPKFQARRVHPRTGTIHLPPIDLDGDGRLDLVALISQEHERIDLLRNAGDREWEISTVWSAGDPAFGLSGLELVDLDRDGDIDFLVTNGDTFDSLSVKPSHGVTWLRNDGNLKFHPQRLTDLSGAYRALAADFDADGDLDIAVSVWLPRQSLQAGVDISSLSGLVMLEQTQPGIFERHTLQKGQPVFAALEIGDFDADGDMDFVTGHFHTRVNSPRDWLTVWWNDSNPNADQ